MNLLTSILKPILNKVLLKMLTFNIGYETDIKNHF